MLNWTKRFNIFCFLDNQQYSDEGYESLLAVNSIRFIDDHSSFKQVDNFLRDSKTWSFGHLSYDLKNQLHQLPSGKKDRIGFSSFFFFQPEILIVLKKKELTIHAKNPDDVFTQLINEQEFIGGHSKAINLKQSIQKEEYISIIEKLRARILRGDCYEINFCQEFFAEEVSIDPAAIFLSLLQLSPTPFSAFYCLNDKYLICASPERFIKRKANKIFSQPMKGTARRSSDKHTDEQLKRTLFLDEKERAENVMVVDLVRNDLSKICKDGSVTVDELFGVYSFPQVHQMVSTVSGELKDETSFSGIIEATFPMGSMTGAPKYKVMQLIEEHEPVGRGLFSGSVGYIDPDGNFDYNVVIRSILFNRTRKVLSYYAGSGITFYSDAEKEWEECLLKAEAIKKVLTGK